MSKKYLSDENGNLIQSEAAYIHIQSVPASTWTINHNLGYRPGGVMAKDSADEWWECNIMHINDNTLQIDFGNGSFSGIAYIS
jgi:hypothetical protein